MYVREEHSEDVYNAKLQANVSTPSLPNKTWLRMGVIEEKSKYNKVMTNICMVLYELRNDQSSPKSCSYTKCVKLQIKN